VSLRYAEVATFEHFNICKLPSSFIFDSDVPGLNASLDHTFSATFRYVSRQWAKHLCRAVAAQNDTDDLLCHLKNHLDNKLLFWIKAMNLIGSKSFIGEGCRILAREGKDINSYLQAELSQHVSRERNGLICWCNWKML
jgi:hypothetical protein